MPSMNPFAAVLILSSVATLSIISQTPTRLSVSERLTATVMREWPAGPLSNRRAPGKWASGEGVLLDGIAAQWRATADGADFVYIKACVDKHITPEGVITGYPDDEILDGIEMGRSILLVYRVTLETRYAKAAKVLRDQPALGPQTAGGNYGRDQMSGETAYVSETFRAAYAATFQQPTDFDDIADHLLQMDRVGLSPKVSDRSMAWYCMTLVDVLDWFPADHSMRLALVAAPQPQPRRGSPGAGFTDGSVVVKYGSRAATSRHGA